MKHTPEPLVAFLLPMHAPPLLHPRDTVRTVLEDVVLVGDISRQELRGCMKLWAAITPGRYDCGIAPNWCVG